LKQKLAESEHDGLFEHARLKARLSLGMEASALYAGKTEEEDSKNLASSAW
jgi:hypothetical protein